MQLLFRTLTPADVELTMRWRTMPEVTRYMYTDFEPSLAQQQAWFESISANDTRRDWIINVDGDDVGLLSIVGIDQVNGRCDWAYYIASPAVRGKGVGKAVELNVLRYVFEELGMNKLCCEVFTFNELVIRIHEKYGSTIEGTRRQHIQKNGEFHDIVEMAILAEEWRANVRDAFDVVPATFEEQATS